VRPLVLTRPSTGGECGGRDLREPAAKRIWMTMGRRAGS
jgi:hypothetical protein